MKMFSLLTAGALFLGIAGANAAELVTLTDTQLDEIAAGQATVSLTAAATAAGFTSAAITIDGTADTTAAPGAYTASGSLTVTSASD